jgi:hypothetical protein
MLAALESDPADPVNELSLCDQSIRIESFFADLYAVDRMP